MLGRWSQSLSSVRPLVYRSCRRSSPIQVFTITTMSAATEARQVPLWINGQDVVTSKTFDVQHPSSGKTVSKVSGAGEEDVYVIIESASPLRTVIDTSVPDV